MPAYEYLCQACDHRFDLRQKMSDPEVTVCPDCGGQVKRLISGGAGAIVKGGSSYQAAPACPSAGQCPAAAQMGCGGGCGSLN